MVIILVKMLGTFPVYIFMPFPTLDIYANRE